MIKLSAVIIAFNEEKHIARCIESLNEVADEVIVVDSFSHDNTVEIAKRLGAIVFQHAFKDYSQQKNYGNAQASHHWILSLDADECLSDALKQSILKVKSNPQHDAYTMNRLNNFCGQWIKHGTWYPDKKLRMWNREKGKWNGEIHEKVEMQSGSSVGHLNGDLLHYTVESVEAYRKQLEKFSDASAHEMFRAGKKTNALVGNSKTAFAFVRSYVLRLGLLDGYNGFRVAYYNALNVKLKHDKLQRLYKDCC
ncbi:MAG TPA: glycosyltransferase family 2 protein [Chitinophagales bacterium]|nr:glycosyltransferase family 2 protein [Chitinophagales bacterium]